MASMGPPMPPLRWAVSHEGARGQEAPAADLATATTVRRMPEPHRGRGRRQTRDFIEPAKSFGFFGTA